MGAFGAGNDDHGPEPNEATRLLEGRYALLIDDMAAAARRHGASHAAQFLSGTAAVLRRIAAGLSSDSAWPEHLHGPLCRLTYVSQATCGDEAALRTFATDIAVCSAGRNTLANITGALAVGAGWFAQTLEGPRNAVLATFDRILADTRHRDVRVLDFDLIKRRRFANWSMIYSGTVAPALMRRVIAGHLRQEQSGAYKLGPTIRALECAMERNLQIGAAEMLAAE